MAMDDDRTWIPVDESRARTHVEEIDPQRAHEGASAKADSFISVIEEGTFLRECIRRSIQSALSSPVITYSTVSELEGQLRHAAPRLVILSVMQSNEASATALKVLLELVPTVPVIVLSAVDDVDLARTALRLGAKGYIPVTMGFEIAVEALRFVLAGGAYVPADYLTARQPHVAPFRSSPPGAVTGRELAVIRAIQQGKSNKTIAYDLCMCETTVKAHVRNVMKELEAKNRTQLAIKAQNNPPSDA